MCVCVHAHATAESIQGILHVGTCTHAVLLVNSFPCGRSIHKHDMYNVHVLM